VSPVRFRGYPGAISSARFCDSLDGFRTLAPQSPSQRRCAPSAVHLRSGRPFGFPPESSISDLLIFAESPNRMIGGGKGRYLNWRTTSFRRRLQHSDESSLVSIRRFGKSRNPGAQFEAAGRAVIAYRREALGSIRGHTPRRNRRANEAAHRIVRAIVKSLSFERRSDIATRYRLLIRQGQHGKIGTDGHAAVHDH
jgi:hypothetical protein